MAMVGKELDDDPQARRLPSKDDGCTQHERRGIAPVPAELAQQTQLCSLS